MALGNTRQETKEKKTYLSINKGKVVAYTSGGTKKYYSYVEGRIRAIYTLRSNFNGEEVKRWYIDLRDGKDLYSLCLPYSSGVFKGIILSLASAKDLRASTLVKIIPYEGNNGFTKVVVYADGEKLEWIKKQLPPRETITIGGKEVKDDTKQMEFVSTLCKEIQDKIKVV